MGSGHSSPLVLASALAFASFLNPPLAHAEGAAAAETHIDELPPWSVRLAVSGGFPLASTREDLLNAEGYGGPRWAFSAELERRIVGNLGLGVMGLYATRSLHPSPPDDAPVFAGGEGPNYSEHAWIVAGEVPISVLTGTLRTPKPAWLELDLVPWAGVGFGSMALHGHGAWSSGFAFGGALRLLFRGRHGGAGLAIGAYSLSLPEPSSVAGDAQLGMIFLSLVGGFDAG